LLVGLIEFTEDLAKRILISIEFLIKEYDTFETKIINLFFKLKKYDLLEVYIISILYCYCLKIPFEEANVGPDDFSPPTG